MKAPILKTSLPFLLIIASLIQFQACKKEPNNANGKTDSPADSYGTLFYGYGPYIAGIGRIYAVNLDSGTMAWNSAAFVYDNNSMLYEMGIIYTCNMYGATAVNTKTGKIKWTSNIASLNHDQSNTQHSNHPVIKDSFLYFISFYTDNEHVGLNCLNKNTGALLWKKNLTQGISPEWIYSTPAVVGDKLIAISHGSSREINRIHCLNRFTGEELWRDISTPGKVWDNPIVLDSNTVLFGSRENTLWKVSVKEKTISVFSNVGSVGRLLPNMNFLLRNKELLIGTDKAVLVLNSNSGQIISSLPDTIESYTISPTAVYIQNSLGKIQANDLNTFAKKWSWTSPLRRYADTVKFDYLITAVHSFLVSDDKIVCYYEAYINPPKININSFYLLDAATGKLLKEIKFPTTPPEFAYNNLMLIRNEQAYYSLSNNVR
jgi:outer membrane protein assembly factor BamB